MSSTPEAHAGALTGSLTGHRVVNRRQRQVHSLQDSLAALKDLIHFLPPPSKAMRAIYKINIINSFRLIARERGRDLLQVLQDLLPVPHALIALRSVFCPSFAGTLGGLGGLLWGGTRPGEEIATTHREHDAHGLNGSPTSCDLSFRPPRG